MEIVIDVNNYLQNGGTITGYEREKGFGKDTVRKKINRLGYSYNKVLKQFVTQNVTQKNIKSNTEVIKGKEIAYTKKSNTNCVTKSSAKEVKKMELKDFKNLNTEEKINYINKFTDGKKTLKQIEKENFTFKNVGIYIPRAEGFWDGKLKKFILIEPKGSFTKEEKEILREIANNYKVEKNINLNTEKDEIILKSVRLYKSAFGELNKYCKENKLKQQDILSIAIKQYIQSKKMDGAE